MIHPALAATRYTGARRQCRCSLCVHRRTEKVQRKFEHVAIPYLEALIELDVSSRLLPRHLHFFIVS